MLRHLKLLILFIACTSFSFAKETLEIYAFLVDFAEEKPDNSLTTGTGLFNTSETSENYSLDPGGRRGTHEYWEHHFQFAKSYYEAASNGQQTISYRIFPENGETAYHLKKGIIDYNRTAKRRDEKVAEYDEARSRDYMTFIYDAVSAANASDDSPFKVTLPNDAHTKRVYMIIHAGASRLVDGGSLGTNGADTQGDFIDVYVSPDYWVYLPKNLVEEDTSKIDSLKGLPLKNAAIDTLKEIMVVSETASQDGLNWGINGILVNQIGRALGMPNTYDVVQGISRLGYFDVMDFAGYNAGNGFFPVFPSAFLRAYMGWSTVKTVSAKAGQKVTVDVAAAGSGLGDEIIKVPLSANEYLLIENRERTLDANGDVSIAVISNAGDSVIYTMPIDSLSTIFEDSIYVKGKAKKNPKKASGIVLSTSSYDACIPASGIAVWKVNEWYLKETIPYGVTNFWGGDTLRDHQYGLALVEADGILTVGKTFKNALGQDTYDYGSGADLIPHQRFSKDSTYKTVYSIKPIGYGNTATLQGGYTGIKITASIPENARKEKTSNSFMGDSVITYAANKISVTIEFEDMALTEGDFPKNIGLESFSRAALLLDYPSGSTKEGEKLLVFGSEDGTLQAMSAFGEELIASDTAVSVNVFSNTDSVNTVLLHRLGKSGGNLMGMAGSGSTVVSLHENKLVRTDLSASLDYITPVTSSLTVEKPVTGPMIKDSLAWVLYSNELIGYSLDGKFQQKKSITLPKGLKAHDFSACKESFAVVFENANFALVNANETKTLKLNTSVKGLESVKEQKFSVVCSDFDRDETLEAFVLGSFGYGAFVKLGDTLTLTDSPRQYVRGGVQESAKYHEISKPAIADVNDDGYPEAVFLGYNKVYAVDYKGISISGFPVTISKGLPEFAFQSEPLLVDVDGESAPEILVPANGGLLYAYKGNGKSVGGYFPMQTGTFEYGDTVKPMSIFVSNAIDSLKGLELYAFHRQHVSAYRLPLADTNSKIYWALPGNGNARTGYFDATLLKDVEISSDKAEVSEFYMYPNPVKGGFANARFTLGMDAKYAELEVFGVTGLRLLQLKMTEPKKGENLWSKIDLTHLGFNVYSVRLNVKFKNGKSKQKFYRIGVVQ